MSTTATHPIARTANRTSTLDEVMRNYLRRLGQPAAPPSIDALSELHRAHVERIPYETFWLHLHEGWGIAPHEALTHIVNDHRGGYCFHLNGALAELLDWLGYTVTCHAAGVHDATGPSTATIGNHLALTVHGLADHRNPEGRWYVDAGLGDALHAPLPLVAGDYQQGPTTYTIDTGDGLGDWSLGHDTSGSFAGVSVTSPPVAVDTFTARHVLNATSPDSPFARTVTAQRRHAAGFDIIRGCVLTSRGATTSTHTMECRAEWLEALSDLFGIRLTAPEESVDQLWSAVRAAHTTWLETSSARKLVAA
jgi:N-hydroxyarylamine O-acetyltransferase